MGIVSSYTKGNGQRNGVRKATKGQGLLQLADPEIIEWDGCEIFDSLDREDWPLVGQSLLRRSGQSHQIAKRLLVLHRTFQFT